MKSFSDAHITVVPVKLQERYRKMRGEKKTRRGTGEFFFLIEISAHGSDVYVPVSASSGKKPSGFVYTIEGTAQGHIGTTEVSVKGPGVTQITLGTILYAKIPTGQTATFRLLVTMQGTRGKKYRIIIERINYKLAPTDARYQRFSETLSSKMLLLG